MPTNLRLTTAGVAAVLDGDNTGTAAVEITKLALGAGSGTGGADDDGLTALRDQRDIVAVAGSAEANGQLAFRAEITSAGAYAATEMGLFARIGELGAEFLFAYWTDGGTVFINKPADLRTIVGVTLSLVNSAADVEVTVTPTISVSAVATLLDLTDMPNSYINAARRKMAVNAAGTGGEFVEGLLPSEEAAVNTLIQNAIDALVGGAPGALDTLNELAAAIGDSANFATAVTNALNARPTTTAVTNAITAALAGYATTAAVAALSKGVTGAVDDKSADYTVVAGDDGKTIEVDATDGAITVSLPDLAAAADGFTVTVLKTDSSTNAVTIDGDGADTINGAATYALESQHEAVVLKWNGTAWRAIGGATGGFLRGFFGDASSREFTTAGSHSHIWWWGAPNGLVITQGGGGGGGGGGGPGNAFSVPANSRGGDGDAGRITYHIISDLVVGSRFAIMIGGGGGGAGRSVGGAVGGTAGTNGGFAGGGASDPQGGGGGGSGGKTTVVMGENTYEALGGGGGGGGGNASGSGAQGGGGGGTAGPGRSHGRGGLGGGYPGAHNDPDNKGRGGVGGGAGGRGAGALGGPEANPVAGSAGEAGRVIFIPLF